MPPTRTARPETATRDSQDTGGAHAPHPAAAPAAPAVSEAEFKTAMRQVASAVSIITARAGERMNGLAATAVCSVSADPPVLLVCIKRGASAEPLIAQSGAFAINFLAEEHHRIARLFSTAKLGAERRFAEGRWSRLVTGAPVLDGALASFDCVVETRVSSGNNSIYIGRVVGTSSLDQDCLIYRAGSFRRLAPVV